MQGDPDLVDVNGKWMCVGTSHGYIQIYDLSGKEIKQHFHSSHLAKSIPDFEKFVNIRINSAGNRVSATAQQKNEEIYEKLFVWDAESDSLGYFSFNSGLTDQQHYEAEAERQKHGDRPKTAAARKIEKERSRFQMPFHLPGNHFWDKNDSRYLICEANHINADNSNNMLLTIFITSDQGVLMHDLQPKPEKADALTQVSIPYLYFLKNAESEEADDLVVERSISRLVLKRIQKEFVGLGEKDKQAIEAMLNFSFYLSAGQMDNAFKSIRFIKNESVWEHMARMCVKTRRIDVARICLGNMQNARAARSLRKCIEDNVPIDVQAARLAIELDMIDEAKSLYTSMGMYNIINKILQTTNRWSEAFEIAEKYDRINLRNTYYNYAKYLESVGAIEAAIENYEKSGTHKFEVPRMLFEEPKALELYIRRRRDSDLQKWWAQYLESIGEMEGAKNYYKTAGDYLSVVRILCFDGRMDEAVEVISETNDKAAAFHLGRQYESAGDIQEAVTYFTKAHAYSSAIRLAKEHNINDKLANLALLAGGSELIEAARHYEEKLGHADKAVMLYHKAGMIGRALDLAFRTEQFGALDLIAKDLDENSDPRVLERAAQFFSNNQQDRMAVQLLAYAKKYSEAVELCRSKNVIINEELAEVISPPKGGNTNAVKPFFYS
uniref:Uncharacterized protein n=1 Tax=Acrobeloides nanus TaxID=290746 RepID=A0A914DM98_9BILA